MISKASGRNIAYHPLTDEQMLEGARSKGMPEPVVAYLGMLYAVVRAGYGGDRFVSRVFNRAGTSHL